MKHNFTLYTISSSGKYGTLQVLVGLVCVCQSVHPSVCLASQTHISVTADRNFLIWGMMMGYDLAMMPVVSIHVV